MSGESRVTSTADTQAIEAALDANPGPWPLKREVRQLLADNARLTAALAEAEGERDRLRMLYERACDERLIVDDHELCDRQLKAAEADAATGRAVARRYRDGWLPVDYGISGGWYWRRYVVGTGAGMDNESMTPAETTYLLDLSAEEGT